jgi:hypothetical protein
VVVRALSGIGIALVLLGLLTAWAFPSGSGAPQRPATTLPGLLAPAGATMPAPTATPTVGGATPPAPVAPTSVAVPSTSPSTTTVGPAPSVVPIVIPTGTAPRTPTAVPTPVMTPPRTATPTPPRTATPTPPTCPTAPPSQPSRAGTATATPTPAAGCVTATPTRTPTPARTAAPLGLRRAPALPGVLAVVASAWGGVLAQAPAPTPARGTDLRLELALPAGLRVGRPEPVTLTLSRTGEVVASTATGVVGTPAPVGTPGVPLELARGPGYAAFAVAKLVVAGAEGVLSAPTTDEQPLDRLDRGPLVWSWDVTARTEGTVGLSVAVDVLFRPTTPAGGQVRQEALWSHRAPIEARQPNALRLGPVSVPLDPLASQLVVAGITTEAAAAAGWLKGRLFGPKTPPRRRRGRGPKAPAAG